ncbi:MAG: aminodeoxychorismate lyase [Candidatus Thioglobus sp.]|nr:aminodeoxychorismate lyase [Candidatus Thioglobus sp.]
MKYVVLINGKKISALNVSNRLVQFGDGLFETCLFENGNLLLWNQHFTRLEAGRKQLNINSVSEKKWLKDITKALGIANLSSAVVKIILARGESFGGYGFKNSIKPVRIVIISNPPKSPREYKLTTCPSGYGNFQHLAKIKHCNRLEQILARTGLKGDECLMLNGDGQVISVTQGNIFAVKNGELFTPNLDHAGIDGTRRAAVLEVAESLGIKIYIGELSLPELLAADEVFITNSLIGIKPVRLINQQLFTIRKITDKISRGLLSLQKLPINRQSIQIKPRRRWLKISIFLLLLVSGWIYLKDVNVKQPVVYQLNSGATISKVAADLKNLGYIKSSIYTLFLAKILNFDGQLKRGFYQISPDMSISSLLQNFFSGQVATRKITLIEGKTINDYYQKLSQNKALKSSGDFAKTLELTGVKPPYEGYFWPDTYQINYGDSVLSVLKRARRILQHRLRFAWQNRDENLQLKSADQALILASLIEKETAHNAEKSRIAGVFIRRLQRGMRLQTDPTVAYALGDKYQGRLSKQDLKFDSLPPPK